MDRCCWCDGSHGLDRRHRIDREYRTNGCSIYSDRTNGVDGCCWCDGSHGLDRCSIYSDRTNGSDWSDR